MKVEDIDKVKEQYSDPFGIIAIEICEKHPMFWSQDEKACRSEIDYWENKIMELINLNT